MAKIKTLVVDSNEQKAISNTSLIKSLGHKAEYVTSGIEAIEVVYRNQFDIIFVELFLPIIDGFQTTKIIRDLPNINELPIIGIGKTSDTSDVEKAFSSGMNNFLLEPLTSKSLGSIIRLYCDIPATSPILSKKRQSLQ